ncbi:hypothetical protein JCM6292_431 [Bacteroides pyogenes JCM 6292]|uniref:Uncharacterized protein n=2 Tax=Bacteroides pyogenes TaxID=310300 RepID=W4PF91_9BACE|nr:hypothetical protein JCM6292_431 [Bacteroides pyogenes JCM 6292]GAE18073.1 hypothetical protein JCM6294_922 [Bacteroides pyogenes DSM 20611 = JCM 6294]
MHHRTTKETKQCFRHDSEELFHNIYSFRSKDRTFSVKLHTYGTGEQPFSQI